MAIVDIENVKAKFEAGDSPRSSDYIDMIDTLAAMPDISGLPSLTTANTFTGGVQQITTASAATKGLIVKATASQSANLLEFQNSGGTAVTFFNASGGLTATEGVISTLYSGGQMTTGTLGYFNATTFSPSVRPIVVRGAASQTANLQEWQNSSGTVLAKIDASGNATLANVTLGLLTSGSDYRGSYGIGGGGLTTSHGAFAMQSWSTTIVTGVLRAAASQTADLQQWQNSAGSVLSYVDSSGKIFAKGLRLDGTDGSNNNIYKTGTLGFLSGLGMQLYLNQDNNATGGPLVIRAINTQTSNLTEWMNSAGTVLTKVTAGGDLDFVNGGVLKVFYIAKAGGGTTVITLGGDDNLQFFSPSSRSGAGNIFIGNSTTIPSSNPTNGGALYVEGGALKFRGSSGTVTTIANA